MSKGYRKILIYLFWLGVWFALALAVNNKILLASPAATIKMLVAMLGKGSFYLTVAGSLVRIALGFSIGFVVAVFLAGVSYRFGWFEELLVPFVNLLKTVPVVSFVVLLLIWWGAEFLAVAVSFWVVFPNIYVNVSEGLKNADQRLLEMAKVFKVSLWNQFFYIFRPALKPFMCSGLKISLGMCWKSGVAAEVIGTPDYSIGERLYLSKVYVDTADLFAWTAVIVLLSMLFERFVMWLVEKFFAWEVPCREWKVSRNGNDATGEKRHRKECGGVVELGNGNVQEKVIRLESVTKSYDGFPVLENLTAEYLPGESYYLKSPSGSGKTTLLRILAGLEKFDSGKLFVPLNCSMMFQEDRLCEDYSAVKNVELVLGGQNRSKSEKEENASHALLKLLPKEALCKPCRELSGGMKRRVALVRAMEADSDYVLLDEPFTGMDAETRRRAEQYILDRQGGRILVIATHI